jgi:membrane protease YdiL (CAAX protease family)
VASVVAAIRVSACAANLAFTAAHALQYNLDALIGVFMAGAILALVRARWSTSEAIVAHALYDLVLFLGGSLDPGS